jgi:hypothetical protein
MAKNRVPPKHSGQKQSRTNLDGERVVAVGCWPSTCGCGRTHQRRDHLPEHGDQNPAGVVGRVGREHGNDVGHDEPAAPARVLVHVHRGCGGAAGIRSRSPEEKDRRFPRYFAAGTGRGWWFSCLRLYFPNHRRCTDPAVPDTGLSGRRRETLMRATGSGDGGV